MKAKSEFTDAERESLWGVTFRLEIAQSARSNALAVFHDLRFKDLVIKVLEQLSAKKDLIGIIARIEMVGSDYLKVMAIPHDDNFRILVINQLKRLYGNWNGVDKKLTDRVTEECSNVHGNSEKLAIVSNAIAEHWNGRGG